MALHTCVPTASLPTTGSSSTMAFRMVRYRLQTLMRVVREAVATGAGSAASVESSFAGGVTRGRIVDKDSGSRRVKNSVEACLYVLEMLEGECRDAAGSKGFEKLSEPAGLRVAV